jgi:hypothetical protein
VLEINRNHPLDVFNGNGGGLRVLRGLIEDNFRSVLDDAVTRILSTQFELQ